MRVDARVAEALAQPHRVGPVAPVLRRHLRDELHVRRRHLGPLPGHVRDARRQRTPPEGRRRLGATVLRHSGYIFLPSVASAAWGPARWRWERGDGRLY